MGEPRYCSREPLINSGFVVGPNSFGQAVKRPNEFGPTVFQQTVAALTSATLSNISFLQIKFGL